GINDRFTGINSGLGVRVPIVGRRVGEELAGSRKVALNAGGGQDEAVDNRGWSGILGGAGRVKRVGIVLIDVGWLVRFTDFTGLWSAGACGKRYRYTQTSRQRSQSESARLGW